jgi:hypothetical protein
LVTQNPKEFLKTVTTVLTKNPELDPVKRKDVVETPRKDFLKHYKLTTKYGKY